MKLTEIPQELGVVAVVVGAVVVTLQKRSR